MLCPSASSTAPGLEQSESPPRQQLRALGPGPVLLLCHRRHQVPVGAAGWVAEPLLAAVLAASTLPSPAVNHVSPAPQDITTQQQLLCVVPRSRSTPQEVERGNLTWRSWVTANILRENKEIYKILPKREKMSLMLSKTSGRTWLPAARCSSPLQAPFTNTILLPRLYQNACFVSKLLHCHKLKKSQIIKCNCSNRDDLSVICRTLFLLKDPKRLYKFKPYPRSVLPLPLKCSQFWK